MWQRPHKPEPADNSSLLSSQLTAEFSREDRIDLLRTAHEAIAAAVEHRPYSPRSTSQGLSEPRGVFTTLYRCSQLCGCVGYVSAVRPLMQAVAETARAAALEDTRFDPVEREELLEIEVLLSVLSPTFPIEPNQIEIGRHGLVIRQNSHRGLLLPQVATEHGWDVDTFLEQTCYKAGLPGNAWQHGAEIEAFTAEIFSDADMRK
jgi:AmmeMemoRadiSam system protein A